MSTDLEKVKNHSVTSMSYMASMAVIGGIFYTGSIAFGGTAVAEEGMIIKNELLLHVQEIDGAGLFLMIPILVGYIAYAAADKPALAPGLVTGYITNAETMIGGNAVKTRFLEALILSLMTGCLVKYMRKIHYPKLVKSVMLIPIISAVASFIVYAFYMYTLANPIGMAMGGVKSFLISLSSGSKTVLGIIMGVMVTVDMGGPVNKTARLFSVGIIAKGRYEFFDVCAAPICTAPLGVRPVTLLTKNRCTQEERDAGKVSLFMGLIGIFEGVIPLAVTDLAKVIPPIMISGAIEDTIAAVADVEDYVPYGGSTVLSIIDEEIRSAIVVIVGTLVIAILVSLLKEPVAQTKLADK